MTASNLGGEDVLVVDFYIDWFTKDIIAETLDVEITPIAKNTRVFHLLSDITTPNGDTFDAYSNRTVEVEYYYPTSPEGWNVSPFVYSSPQSFGIASGIYDGDKIYIQSGNDRLWIEGVKSGGSNTGVIDYTTPKMCRLHLTGIK